MNITERTIIMEAVIVFAGFVAIGFIVGCALP